MSTGTSGAGRNRRARQFQGLRSIAVLVVVAFHVGTTPRWLHRCRRVLCHIRVRHCGDRSGGGIGPGRVPSSLYFRRFKRLTPGGTALGLVVLVTMVLTFALLPPFDQQQNAAKTGLGAMLLAANVVIATTTGGYFGAPAEANPLLNTWSLSVEEQFYLVFPALLVLSWIAARRTTKGRWASLVVIGLLDRGFAWARGVRIECPCTGPWCAGPGLLQPPDASLGVWRWCAARTHCRQLAGPGYSGAHAYEVGPDWP